MLTLLGRAHGQPSPCFALAAEMRARVSSHIAVAPRYDWLPYAGKGLMVAQRPWDGSYNVSDTIWVAAHTTQFTERGWHYLGGEACGLLDGARSAPHMYTDGPSGSYVSLVSPDGQDLTIIIETVTAAEPQALSLRLAGKLARISALHAWTTVEGAVFQHGADVPVVKGVVTVTVPPNAVWTLSTTTGQAKGTGSPIPTQTAFPMPYKDDFESYPEDTLAKYFSDLHGSYAVFTAADGNKVLRQQAGNIAPKSTHGGASVLPWASLPCLHVRAARTLCWPGKPLTCCLRCCAFSYIATQGAHPDTPRPSAMRRGPTTKLTLPSNRRAACRQQARSLSLSAATAACRSPRTTTAARLCPTKVRCLCVVFLSLCLLLSLFLSFSPPSPTTHARARARCTPTYSKQTTAPSLLVRKQVLFLRW